MNRIRFLIQSKRTASTATIKAAFQAIFQNQSVQTAHVAVAYATVSGVRALLGSMPRGGVRKSQWLFGLDDCITQPGAIDAAAKLPGAELRVASLGAVSRRFHPKVYYFQSDSVADVIVIGSANLTDSALSGNSEAVAQVEAKSPSERAQMKTVWHEIWKQGHQPTSLELKEYTARYKVAKRFRKQAQHAAKGSKKKPKLILEGDTAELDPAQATICWIECGYNTAMGRELEFKAEQALFFGLNPSGAKARVFRFQTSAGTFARLRLKYQARNSMWRLQLNNKVPEVRIGLRPRRPNGTLGRSPYVAIIKRTVPPGSFLLRFFRHGSKDFRSLEKRSQEFGTVGHTTARTYGWC